MSARLPVRKTYKLYIGGAFPRSESGRTLELEGHNVARASRKDARDAVVAAREGVRGMERRRPPTTAARCSTGWPRRWRRGTAALAARVRRPAGGGAGDRPRRLVRRLGGQARPGARRLEPRRRAVLQLHRARADRRRRRDRARRARARRPRRADRSRARRRQRRRRRRLGGAPARGDRARGGRRDVRRAAAASSTCSPAGARSSRRCSRRTWTSTRST